MSEARNQNHRRSDLSESFAEARTGLFRATLLFGAIAAALSLIVVPAVDRRAKMAVAERMNDVDPMTTASTPSGINSYVVRRSVLDDATAPCLLFPDGTQRGAC